MSKQQLLYYIREWRESRGMTQQQLADDIGRDKSIISKLERGISGVTGPVLERIAESLGTTPAALYELPPPGTRPVMPGEAGQAGNIALRRQPVATGLVSDRADLPIYASAAGGETGMLVNFDPIDWVKRPEPLFNVPTGFGMYVLGDSMIPAYRQGDMILIHPRKPPNPGDDVLIVMKNGDGDAEALVKNLVSVSTETIKLRQYNAEPELFDIPAAKVEFVFLIVGKYNRR